MEQRALRSFRYVLRLSAVLATTILIGSADAADTDGGPPGGANEPRLISVRRIWDRAPHNAFTDLVRFQDRWFCTFREGQDHVSPDGSLRVIVSADGEQWESAALISSSDSDLRDPKLAVTPNGRLTLYAVAALHDKSEHTHQSVAWLSNDGHNWTEQFAIGEPDIWLWRVTWYQGIAYGVGYGCGEQRLTRLYSSTDGTTFRPLVAQFFEGGYPNETALVFDRDEVHCLLRRDGSPGSAQLGSARAPFTQWQWKDLGVQVGGPHMLRLPDGRFIAAVRLYDRQVRTSLCRIDPQAGKLTEFLPLPSDGDSSYAGLVLHDGLLWVSYYSSHEGKTAIYLAKVGLSD